MALLTGQIDDLLRDNVPQWPDGDPCPAANGCPGGLIIRVRRDGVLRTFEGGEGVQPDAWAALSGAAELLRGWAAEADAALPQAMVVMPTEPTRQVHGDAPPRSCCLHHVRSPSTRWPQSFSCNPHCRRVGRISTTESSGRSSCGRESSI